MAVPDRPDEDASLSKEKNLAEKGVGSIGRRARQVFGYHNNYLSQNYRNVPLGVIPNGTDRNTSQWLLLG
jgi:hypothetical protein